MKEKEIEFQIILNEYNLVNNRIDEILTRQDTMMQIAMAVIGGTIAWTIANNVADEFLISIPIIVLVLYSHIFYSYSRLIAFQGYKEFLQQRLRRYTVENELHAPNIAKEFLLETNPITKFNRILFPSILLMSILYSIIASNYNMYNVIAALSVFIIAFKIVFSFYKYSNGLNEKVKNYCEENV